MSDRKHGFNMANHLRRLVSLVDCDFDWELLRMCDSPFQIGGATRDKQNAVAVAAGLGGSTDG